MSAPPVLLLSRSAISGLATTRDYLAAMQDEDLLVLERAALLMERLSAEL